MLVDESRFDGFGNWLSGVIFGKNGVGVIGATGVGIGVDLFEISIFDLEYN